MLLLWLLVVEGLSGSSSSRIYTSSHHGDHNSLFQMHGTLLFDIFEPQRGDVMSTGGVYLPLLNKVGDCSPQRTF